MTLSVREQGAREKAFGDWHWSVVAPHDTTKIDLRTANAVLDVVWSDYGLKHPPTIIMKEPTNGKVVAHANRMGITLYGPQTTITLLHEIGHSMWDGVGLEKTEHAHGDGYLSINVDLLSRYIPILNKGYLMSTLSKIGRFPSWTPTLRCS